MSSTDTIIYISDILQNGSENYTENKKFIDDNNIKITSMNLSCHLNTDIYINLFLEYDILREDKNIMITKCCIKPSLGYLVIEIVSKTKKMCNIRIKMYKNGSLHISSNTKKIRNVVDILIDILKTGYDKQQQDGTIKHINFISDLDKIELKDVKITTIICNFKLGHKIDIKLLRNFLLANYCQETNNTDIKKIKFRYNKLKKMITINYIHNMHKNEFIIFKCGTIIMFGSKTLCDIIDAYIFINTILEKYYSIAST